jgi:hypothetical protein
VPDLKTKQQIADLGRDLAVTLKMVHRGGVLYIPVHWDTMEYDPPPAPDETVWLPLSPEERRELGNTQGNILFYSEGEIRSFELVLKQYATTWRAPVEHLLVRTPQGLRVLTSEGKLEPAPGYFMPNYIRPMLNEDPAVKEEIFKTITEWVGSEEAAHSLLHHLATSLSPSYSAVKYVLLLGEGRNGKGLLLSMLVGLFGIENISSVSRQMMAEHRSTVTQLNGKLLNVIFDGEMAYIKDSSAEKTLIAGEPLDIEMKYENSPTRVQTNALFIEALQVEPKARDKSSALQKRLVRFYFPNVYAVDKAFEKKMTSERALGAFLSLLIDHYVQAHEIADKLKLTDASLELQMEQMWMGNPMLQFMEHLAMKDMSALDKVASGKTWLNDFLNSFKPWAESQNMQERNDGDLVALMKSAFVIDSKTRNDKGKRSTQRYIKELRPETELLYNQLKGAHSGTGLLEEEVVGD